MTIDKTYGHVIGALLLDPQTNIPKAKSRGIENFFPFDREKAIFKAIIDLGEQNNNGVDTTIVAEAIAKGNQDIYMNVATYLAECEVSCSSSHLFDEYVESLKQSHIREQVKRMVQWMGTKVQTMSLEELFAKMSHVLQYSETLKETKDLLNYQEIQTRYCETLESDLEGNRDDYIMKYGIKAMDEIGTPLRKTNLIVVGACPRIGKSLLSVNIARNLARQKKHVLYYSLEMDVEEVMDRYYSAYTYLPYAKIVNRDFMPRDVEELYKVVSDTEANLTMKCSGVLSLDDIDKDLHLLSMRNPVDCVIVDYIQLMRDKSTHSIYESVTKISNGLKQLAQKHKIVMIALAQLNREGMKNQPELHHLAQSGAIEQAANVVWLLDKDDQKELDADPNKMYILLRKNRSGRGHADLEVKVDYNKMLIS